MKHYPFLTISGASGAGKTTLMEALIERYPERFHRFQSVTTRTLRPTDMDSYISITPEEFTAWEKAGKFAWTLDVHNTRYGTTKESIDEAIRDKRASIFVIAPDIVEKLEDIVGKDKIFAVYVLSCTPEALRRRLLERGDAEGVIERRINDCLLWDARAQQSAVPFRFVENSGTVDELVNNVLKLLIEDRPNQSKGS